MVASDRGFFSRWFGGFWRLLDGTRRLLLNLLFLALIVALVWAWFHRAGPALQDKTVLVLNLRGPVVEQRSGTWRDTALGRVRLDDHVGDLREHFLLVLERVAVRRRRLTQ